MKHLTSASILLLILLFACKPSVTKNEHVDEGVIQNKTYQSKEVGWSIEIPEKWKIITIDSAVASDQVGLEAIEKVYDGEINPSQLRHLISFEKDDYNNFASTSEPFKEEYPGEYLDNNQKLYKILYDAFYEQGVRADTASGKEMIAGLEFDTFYTTLYDPEGNIIMHQLLYSRLINNLDFGININYNNEADKKIMIDALKNSKFTQ